MSMGLRLAALRAAGAPLKLTQYEDDTTTFVKDGASLGKLLELLDLFHQCSGLKINSTKSVEMQG